MGPGRPRRRKTIVLSSDDDDDTKQVESANEQATIKHDSETNVKPKRASRANSTRTKSTEDKSIPKTRPSRKPAKPTEDAPPKPSNKSIYSFFNAATQRQQTSSQDSTGPTPSALAAVLQEEDIEDDLDTPVPPSRPVNPSQILLKRKIVKEDVAQDDERGLPPSQKFRKSATGSKISTTVEHDARSWIERFAPTNLFELAVHKKKVNDVRILLEAALSDRPRPRLIVLKGAAGTAKTTTINLLAKDMAVDVVEWKSPVGADASSAVYTSYSAQFEDFVFRSGKFVGLDLVDSDRLPLYQKKQEASPNSRQIMLVEEFPSTLVKSSTALQSFRDTILHYLAAPLSSSPTPMVMIISEALLSTTTASADSFTAHRLLGPSILNHPNTAPVEFNKIAPTILVKALEDIVVKEARKSGRRSTPGVAVLKHLAETGDIRSAVSSLEFLCLAGDDSESWSAKVAFTKPKGRKEVPMTKKEQEALKLVSNRESSLGIFHAVGRVVYNKRVVPETPVIQPPTYLPQHRKPKVPEHDPNDLIDEIGTETPTFIAALQENYALSCSSLSSEDAMDSLNGCIHALSDSDMLSCDRFGFGTRTSSGSTQDNLRQDDMSFQAAVRGLLFWLPSPVNRLAGLPRSAKRGDEFKMFFPSSSKLWKEKEEFEGTLENVISTMHALAVSSSSNLEDRADTEVSILPSSIPLSSAARTETLLERLPYASRILPRRRNVPQSLTASINTLTLISTLKSASAPLDEESMDVLDDDDEHDLRLSEWTDRPEPDIVNGQRGKASKKQKQEFEGGGLRIPVEHAIEKLVLSDDDIEDDE
jgi:cell cycle checkpoint protein